MGSSPSPLNSVNAPEEACGANMGKFRGYFVGIVMMGKVEKYGAGRWGDGVLGRWGLLRELKLRFDDDAVILSHGARSSNARGSRARRGAARLLGAWGLG